MLRSALPAGSRLSPSGFYTFKCPLCSDYKTRAGLRIDAGELGFNCFNCEFATKYIDGDCSIPSKIVTMFLKLGGDEEQINILKTRLVLNEGEALPLTNTSGEAYVDGYNIFYRPPPIALPESFITLEQGLVDNIPEAIEAATYLIEQRNCPLDPSTVYVDVDRASDYYERLILPVTMWGKVVGYSGRTYRNADPKYLTQGPKAKLIFNYEVAHGFHDRPLFVVEGQFDAIRVKGVAVMGNTLSDHQVHWLEQCTRPKVVIPDRGKAGMRLAQQAIDLGWGVSTPDFGSIKDVDDAVSKLGYLYSLYQILSAISYGDTALVKLQAYCKGA